LRKKIPTITRPDPAYAAALRSEGEEDPEREERAYSGRSGPGDCKIGAAYGSDAAGAGRDTLFVNAGCPGQHRGGDASG
jgi:hypothetical protein